MSETVLCVPLFMVVLAFLVYFGQGMVRVQHASVMDRYHVWQQVGAANGGTWGPHIVNNPRSYRQLNETFFAGNAESISADAGRLFPDDAQVEMVSRARNHSFDAASLLDRVFANLPGGSSVTFHTDHTNSVRLFEPFEGPITHAHTRMHNDWRFVNGQQLQGDGTWEPGGSRVSHNNLIVEEFFRSLDDVLSGMAGNRYAGMIRNLYFSTPGYAGPDVQ